MKKVFLWASAALIMGSIALTSCSKEEDEERNNPNPETYVVPEKVKMKYTYYSTEDMLQFLDIVVTYNDGTGEKEDTITTSPWTKELTTNLPAEISFVYKARVKEGMYETMAALDSVHYTRHYAYSYDIIDTAGNVIPSSGTRYSSDNNPSQGGVGETIARKYNEGKFDRNHFIKFAATGMVLTSIETGGSGK